MLNHLLRDEKKEEKNLVKLNLGCGTDYKKGWVNIDNNSDHNIRKLDIDWDLRNPLPYDDDGVDYIYNEHLLEHLTVEEGQGFIKECLRVLKRGGVMRVATPDLSVVVERYAKVAIKNDPVIKKYKLDYIKTRGERINVEFRSWGHQWLYDWEELERRLKEAGCRDIVRTRINESNHQELKNLETRAESTLIAEVTK